MSQIAGAIVLLGAALMAAKCSEFRDPGVLFFVTIGSLIVGGALLRSKGDAPRS